MYPPTIAGFISWVRAVMGITTTVLPDSSVYFTYAFEVAMMVVNQQLNTVSYTASGSAATISLYTLAVYNCAGSNLLNFAQDLPDAPPYEPYSSTIPYFQYVRQQFGINSFVPGLVQASTDERTNSIYLIQEAAKDFTLSDLQYLKDPYGRQYLAFAQKAGTIWGLS